MIRIQVDQVYNRFLVEGLRNHEQGLNVRFRLHSDPTVEFKGRLKRLDYTGALIREREDSQFVEAEVEIDREDLGELLQIGTGASVRIDCGQRSYYYLFTYEIREKLRSWFFY